MKNVEVDADTPRDGAIWVYTDTAAKTAEVCNRVAMRSDSTTLRSMERNLDDPDHKTLIVINVPEEHTDIFVRSLEA